MSVKHNWQDGEKVTAANLNELAEAINGKVIGTNDGTNWTSLTIDGTEMAIPNGDELTAGDGIDITNDVISVDNTIALKSELPTATSDLTNDSGFITSSDIPSTYSWTSITDKPTFATVATSGSYNDLSNKPTIPTVPTNVSAFTNDAGYLTQHQSLAAYRTSAAQDVIDAGKASIDSLADVAFSGDYEDLSNTPTIPTATSDLTNDSGFITNSALAGYATETYVDNAIDAEAQVARAAELELNQKWDAQADAIAELSTGKQNTLTAGTNITIVNDVISATSAIESVNGQTGTIVLDASDINTEDDITIDEAISGIKTDITGLDTGKQDKITSSNKLSYNLLSDTPTIPAATSDLTNDSGFITSSYHDSTKQDVLTAGENITIENNVISATGGGQPQFEQVIVKMEDCIDQQRSTQDYICFRFNYEINTFFPIQIVLEAQSTYSIRGALSFFGGAVLKFNSSTYATGAQVESLEGLEIGSGSGDNYIIIGRDELEAFSGYDEEHTGDNYCFILYKIVGNTKSGCIEV